MRKDSGMIRCGTRWLDSLDAAAFDLDSHMDGNIGGKPDKISIFKFQNTLTDCLLEDIIIL